MNLKLGDIIQLKNGDIIKIVIIVGFGILRTYGTSKNLNEITYERRIKDVVNDIPTFNYLTSLVFYKKHDILKRFNKKDTFALLL